MPTIPVTVRCRKVGAIGTFADRVFDLTIPDDAMRFRLDTLDAIVDAWFVAHGHDWEMNCIVSWLDPSGHNVTTFGQMQKWRDEKHSPARTPHPHGEPT